MRVICLLLGKLYVCLTAVRNCVQMQEYVVKYSYQVAGYVMWQSFTIGLSAFSHSEYLSDELMHKGIATLCGLSLASLQAAL